MTQDVNDGVLISLLNAHCEERCFLPIHIYDAECSRPVAVILLSGKTPSGVEISGHVGRLVKCIRRHWPTTRITFHGGSHHASLEVMSWCEANGISCAFSLAGTKPLTKKADAIPNIQDLARAEFATLWLLMIAARIMET